MKTGIFLKPEIYSLLNMLWRPLGTHRGLAATSVLQACGLGQPHFRKVAKFSSGRFSGGMNSAV